MNIYYHDYSNQNDHGYHYIYAFSRHFYPKRLTVHSGYIFFVSMCSLGIEPTTFALLTQCSNHQRPPNTYTPQYRQAPVTTELSRLQFTTPVMVETAVHSPVMAAKTESAHKMAVIPEFHPVTVIDPEPCHVTANLPEP